jgi:NADH-quinone oxidoreductase subunit M
MHGFALSVLVWLPIAAGLVVLALGDQRLVLARWVALGAAVVTLLLTLPLVAGFDTSTAAFQFVEHASWIRRFDAYYALGLDGISLPLVVLTAFVTVPVVIAG